MARVFLLEPTVLVPAVAAVVGALFVGAVAFLIWGMNVLMRMTERITKLEAGQARLEEGQEELKQGQARLETGQEELRQGQAKLEAGLAELRQGQAKLEQGQEELRKGQAKLGEVLYDILLLLNNPRSPSDEST